MTAFVRPDLPSAPTGFVRQHLRALLVMAMIGGALIGTLLGLTVGPHSPRLGEPSTGDPALAADVRAVLASDRGFDVLSVGRVRAGTVTFAGLGEQDGAVPTPQTPFEMGSITKTFTGMLLADAVERNELAVEDRLAQHLPELAGTPAGDVTLFELATHSAGLPPFPPDLMMAGLGGTLRNENPYDVSVARVLETSRAVELEKPGAYAYSNLGMSLLGHAEARAAGAADWPSLATERILTPLGMTSTVFAVAEDDIPAGAPRGRKDNGWRAPRWYGAGFAPAGSSTWTTGEDLTRFAAAVLAERAPGLAALESEAEGGLGQVGLAWHISEFDGREITWHNGGTGGMRSMLALDRERDQGVVVLGNTTRWVDGVAATLAAAAPDGPLPALDFAWPGIPAIAATLAGIGFLIALAQAALRGRHRLAVAAGLLGGVTGLLILLAFGPWVLVPAWIWGSVTGAAAALAAYAVLRARDLPNLPAKRPALAWINAALSLIVLGFVIVAL